MKFCKQDISETKQWIFAKFIPHTLHTQPWKWLTFSANDTQLL